MVKRIGSTVDHTMLDESVGDPSMEGLGHWFLARVPVASRVVIRRPTLGYVVEVKRGTDMKVSESDELLRARIDDLEREVADLRRHNSELRETVKALLAPTRAPVETMGGRIG